jgi:hypothetical protein
MDMKSEQVKGLTVERTMMMMMMMMMLMMNVGKVRADDLWNFEILYHLRVLPKLHARFKLIYYVCKQSKGNAVYFQLCIRKVTLSVSPVTPLFIYENQYYGHNLLNV